MPRQGLTKEIIILKALDIINRSGYQMLTFVNLAKELDVKPPAMFKHFNNLEDLKCSLTLKAVNGLKENLQKSLIGISGKKAISSLCHTYREFARNNHGLYISMQSNHFKDREVSLAATELMSIIVSIIKGFDINEKNHIHIVRLIRSSLHGFAILETDFNFGMSKDIDESFQLQIEAILYMIQSYS